MVETPSMHLQRPERTDHNSQNEITGPITPITCVICAATYAPSHLSQRFLQVSPVVLESAYMSMCHFCFRCRRPACPECWDAVHGICGACVQEANLPFRTQVKPLDGILFPPVSPTSPTSQAETIQDNTASSLFVCVKHGKFHPPLSPSNDISNIQPTETATKESTSKPPQAIQNISHQPPATSAVPADPYIAVSQGDSPGAGLAPALKTSTSLKTSAILETSAALKAASVKRRRSIVKKIELVFTILVLLILLAIAIMIGLAEYSPAANTFINHLLHIDIRAEIAYLLHLVQQLL